MTARGRRLLLLAILTVVALATAGIVIRVLYRAAFEERRSQLVQIAQSQARRREMALRASLGAPRRRIVRQLFTESLVLTTLAGTALSCGREPDANSS